MLCVKPVPGWTHQLEGHCRGPKGLGEKVPGSGVCDAQQQPPFQAPNDIFRYTTRELRSVTTQYSTNNEAAELHPTPSRREVTPRSGKEVSSDIAVHDAKEGKGQQLEA
jgi:hypothetical protein